MTRLRLSARPAAAAAALAALLLAAALPLARAQISNAGPQGPRAIQCGSTTECSLVQQMLSAAVSVSTNAKAPVVAAASAARPPANVTSSQVAKALGAVLAAGVLESSVLDTLGNPSRFKYPDGSGRWALFRLPQGTKVKGTCIFIHGCKHDPMSWFYKSDKCQDCTGLPEEVSHSKQCLARGYAVIALMSKDRAYRSRCFSSSANPSLNDHPSAKQVLDAWFAKYGLNKLPKYIFGISSGAAFAIKFPRTYPGLAGVVSEVNMPWQAAWGMTDAAGKFKVAFPPTVYYEMVHDPQTAQQIAAVSAVHTGGGAEASNRGGVRCPLPVRWSCPLATSPPPALPTNPSSQALRIFKANKVPADVIITPERNVTPTWLSQRSIYISATQARQIQAALRKIGVINAQGFITSDPRKVTGWTKKLPTYLPWLTRSSPYYNLISDESQVWQELNLAYSQHEIVSDHVRPTLMWLEARGRANLTALVNQYSLNQNIACLSEWREGCPGISNDQLNSTATATAKASAGRRLRG
jgi:hypothetical protein